MMTEEGKAVERLLGKLQFSENPDYGPLVEAFDKMTELLDATDEADFFGTEGWRKRIGWED